MSDSAPIEPAGDPAPESVAAPEPVVTAPVDDGEPITDDAAIAADIEASAVAIPDGERLIPESKLRNVAISYRNKLREAKQGSPDAARLQDELNRVTQQLNQMAPMAQAFHALQQAQQHQPPQQQQVPPENTAKLEKIAKTFDFYRGDGSPDLDRARDHLALVREEAQAASQESVAPLVGQSLKQQALRNIQHAKNTEIGGERVDPAIIDNLVAQIARQPKGMETLADVESVKHLWVNAFGQMKAMHAMQGGKPAPASEVAAQVTQPPPVVVTERSGGQAPNQQRQLSAIEKRAAKEAGLSEKAYTDMAKNMPW